MRIPLDRQSEIPLYVQIRDSLRESIVTGNLPAKARLPASRQLAADLGVSRVTIENAYADLEAEGLIVRRTGSGSYVSFHARPGPIKRGGEVTWPLWQRELAELDGEGEPGVDQGGVEGAVHGPAQGPVQDVDQGAVRGAGRHADPGTREAIDPGIRKDADLGTGDVIGRDDVISFTGFGDPRQFRIEEFYGAIREVVRRDGVSCLEMDDERGYRPLRTSIAHILTSQGIEAHPDHVLVTSGSQQALAIVTQLLLKPGDTVLVESPTYDGAIQLFRAHGLRMIGCPVDARGMQVEELEPLLQQYHPKLIYTIPTFQNPTGACMAANRRRQLIELADRYNIPIFEDDFAGDLRYEGTAQPALKALDPGGRVIYASTFSKLLMPGLRLGFLVAEGPVYEKLVETKRVNDLASGSLIQRALEVYVTVGRYHAHLRRLCQAYRRRRDRMMQAIRESFPPGWEASVPHGGLFLWLRLPQGVSAVNLTPLALAQGVRYAPGTRFFPDQVDGEAYIRLNFAAAALDVIEEGIQRLARAVDAAMQLG